jgi:hypothetical protein
MSMKAIEQALIVAGVLTSMFLLSQTALAESASDSTVAIEGTACEVDSECGALQFCDTSIVFCEEPLNCPDPEDTDCLKMAEKINEKYGTCEPGPINECRDFPENSCLNLSDCDGPAYECHYLESCACWGSAGDGGSAQEECVCSTKDYGTCLLKMETCETASDCTGDFEQYECADTLFSGHCFVKPDGYVGHNQEKYDDTALCLGGLLLNDSVCAPEYAVKPPSEGPITSDPHGGNDQTPKNTGASSEAAAGCTIGSGAGAGGAVLPMLVLLVGWVTRRRFAATH